MVVGDQFTAALTRTDSTRLVRSEDSHTLHLRARFTSSDTSVLAVTSGNRLRAMAPGTAAVTGTSVVGDSTHTVSTLFHVVTRRQDVNHMVAEVCPNDDESNFLEQAPVDDDVPAIHEFHDCQRLIAGHEYGPVVGVFAHGNVMDVASWQDFERGLLVAIIVNFGGSSGRSHYSSLGIAPGVNCLYLHAASATSWGAVMVRQSEQFLDAGARRYGSCDSLPTLQQRPGGPRPTRLTVQRQVGVDMVGRPLAPPVARWDWDPVNRLNYIGVKCGTATWCEVGPANFRASPPRILRRSGTQDRQPAQQIIKGFYDEQFLADSLTKRPTTVFGTVMPGKDATSASSGAPQRGDVLHVADIILQERGRLRSPDYRRYARALMRKIDPREMEVRDSLMLQYSGLNETNRKYDGMLGGRPLETGAIVYRRHGGHAANMQMPTARWRWLDNDELVWSYCKPDGCCEVIKTH